MKKLFALLWFSIVMLTAVCGLIFYTDSRKSQQSSQNNAQAAIYTMAGTKPTLPLAPSAQVRTKPASDRGALGTDYKAMQGSGKSVSAPDSSRAPDAEPATEAESAKKYTFTEEMYPYRAMLSKEQQEVYDDVYAAAVERRSDCAVGAMISQDALNDVMTAVYNDHPELFYLDTQYSYEYSGSGRVLKVTLKYNATAADYENSLKKFNDAADTIIKGASALTTAEDKEKYVYNAIMDSVKYNASAPVNQSAYSALVNKESVCAGYSRAFQYIMQKLDIPCYLCTGYSKGGAHAWNIVKLGDAYYNADISWDDSLGESGGYTYRYYNVSDEKFSVDHTRKGLSVKLPKAAGE